MMGGSSSKPDTLTDEGSVTETRQVVCVEPKSTGHSDTIVINKGFQCGLQTKWYWEKRVESIISHWMRGEYERVGQLPKIWPMVLDKVILAHIPQLKYNGRVDLIQLADFIQQQMMSEANQDYIHGFVLRMRSEKPKRIINDEILDLIQLFNVKMERYSGNYGYKRNPGIIREIRDDFTEIATWMANELDVSSLDLCADNCCSLISEWLQRVHLESGETTAHSFQITK